MIEENIKFPCLKNRNLRYDLGKICYGVLI